MGCRDLLDSRKRNLSKFRAFRAGVGSSAAEGDSPGCAGGCWGCGRVASPAPTAARTAQALRRGDFRSLALLFFSEKVSKTCTDFLFPTHCLGEIQLPGSETSIPTARWRRRSRGRLRPARGLSRGCRGAACAHPGGAGLRGATAAGRAVGTVPHVNHPGEEARRR